MLRVRASAFLAGFAVASAVAMYQLQKEVWASHRTLAAQAQGYHSDLESRIIRLEKSSGAQLPSGLLLPSGAQLPSKAPDKEE